MVKWVGVLVAGLLAVSGCGRPAVVGSTAGLPRLAVSGEALGHFRLKLLIAQKIVKAQHEPGPVVALKTYPPVVAGQADFYLAPGAAPESIATLADGRRMLLHFTDLACGPERATARQFLISGNFGTKVVTGQGDGSAGEAGAFTYDTTNSVPPPTFLVNKSEPTTVWLDAFTQGGVSVEADYQYELTYLGATNARELMAVAQGPVQDLSRDPLQRQIEADAAALRGQDGVR